MKPTQDAGTPNPPFWEWIRPILHQGRGQTIHYQRWPCWVYLMKLMYNLMLCKLSEEDRLQPLQNKLCLSEVFLRSWSRIFYTIACLTWWTSLHSSLWRTELFKDVPLVRSWYLFKTFSCLKHWIGRLLQQFYWQKIVIQIEITTLTYINLLSKLDFWFLGKVLCLFIPNIQLDHHYVDFFPPLYYLYRLPVLLPCSFHSQPIWSILITKAFPCLPVGCPKQVFFGAFANVPSLLLLSPQFLWNVLLVPHSE